MTPECTFFGGYAKTPKMVIDYEAGKIRAHRAAELLATHHRVDAVFFLR